MADEADLANNHAQQELDAILRQAAETRGELEKGVAGECEYCGYHKPRLIGGACAPCRDEFGLP